MKLAGGAPEEQGLLGLETANLSPLSNANQPMRKTHETSGIHQELRRERDRN